MFVFLGGEFPVRANSEYNEQTVYESVWRGLVRNTEEVLDFPAMFKQEATSPFWKKSDSAHLKMYKTFQ